MIELFCSFLEEFEDSKKSFWNQLTFSKSIIASISLILFHSRWKIIAISPTAFLSLDFWGIGGVIQKINICIYPWFIGSLCQCRNIDFLSMYKAIMDIMYVKSIKVYFVVCWNYTQSHYVKVALGDIFYGT